MNGQGKGQPRINKRQYDVRDHCDSKQPQQIGTDSISRAEYYSFKKSSLIDNLEEEDYNNCGENPSCSHLRGDTDVNGSQPITPVRSNAATITADAGLVMPNH